MLRERGGAPAPYRHCRRPVSRLRFRGCDEPPSRQTGEVVPSRWQESRRADRRPGRQRSRACRSRGSRRAWRRGSQSADPARPRAFLLRRDRRKVWRQSARRDRGLSIGSRPRRQRHRRGGDLEASERGYGSRSRSRRDRAGGCRWPFVPVPEDMMEKANLPALSYSSPLEGLAERYHSSPALLKRLNPDSEFDRAGEEILAPNVDVAPPGKAASVVVSRSRRSVATLDARGRTLSRYPATSGSEHDPLPIGRWKILGVGRDPSFHYNPELFWDAKGSDGRPSSHRGPTTRLAWPGSICPRSITASTARPSRRRSARRSRMDASA